VDESADDDNAGHGKPGCVYDNAASAFWNKQVVLNPWVLVLVLQNGLGDLNASL